jgi:hypothetical protein
MKINHKVSWQLNMNELLEYVISLEERVVSLESAKTTTNTKVIPKPQKAPEQALVDENDGSTDSNE